VPGRIRAGVCQTDRIRLGVWCFGGFVLHWQALVVTLETVTITLIAGNPPTGGGFQNPRSRNLLQP